MKKLFFIIICAFIGTFVFAQKMKVHTGTGTSDYYLVEIDSITFEIDTAKTFTGSKYITSFAWSPDGNKIAFIQADSAKYWACNLVIANPDFSSQNIIYPNLYFVGLCDWHNNGILFRKSSIEGNQSSYSGDDEIWKIQPDGTGLTQLTYTFTNGIMYINMQRNRGTAWRAKFVNGTGKIYFIADNGNGWPKSYLCNSNGTDQYSLVSTGYSWVMAVSPTGNRLFFTTSSNHNTTATIYTADASGANASIFKSNIIPGPGIVVSPNGTKVAYTGGIFNVQYSPYVDSANRDIHICDIDGTNDNVLISDSYDDGFATFVASNGYEIYYEGNTTINPWTPDGEWIFFTSNRGGNYHIYKIKVDGTGIQQISSGNTYDFAPNVSPDGLYLAYLSIPVGSETGSSPLPMRLIIIRL